LTKERGKLTAFARGARRQNSKLAASTGLFAFGSFTLYPGRSAYTLSDARIDNFFEELRTDYEGAYYGMYFLEFCDYYTRENNDEMQMLKLLYQSLKALSVKSLSHRLVRCIFELKAFVVNGEFPGMPQEGNWQESTAYAIHFIESEGVERLYTFTVSDSVLEELCRIADNCRKRLIDRKLNSLEMLSMLS
jgi:DNA repair protein RecO (recombination protein O)